HFHYKDNMVRYEEYLNEKICKCNMNHELQHLCNMNCDSWYECDMKLYSMLIFNYNSDDFFNDWRELNKLIGELDSEFSFEKYFSQVKKIVDGKLLEEIYGLKSSDFNQLIKMIYDEYI